MIAVSDRTEFREKVINKTKEVCFMMTEIIIHNEDLAVRNPIQALHHSNKTTENMRKN